MGKWECYTAFESTIIWQVTALFSYSMSFWMVVDENKAEHIIMKGV